MYFFNKTLQHKSIYLGFCLKISTSNLKFKKNSLLKTLTDKKFLLLVLKVYVKHKLFLNKILKIIKGFLSKGIMD